MDRKEKRPNDPFRGFKKQLKAAITGQPDPKSAKQEGSLEWKDEGLNWTAAESRPAKNTGVPRRPLEKRKKMTKVEDRNQESAQSNTQQDTAYDWNTSKPLPSPQNTFQTVFESSVNQETTKEMEFQEREHKLKRIYEKEVYLLHEDIKRIRHEIDEVESRRRNELRQYENDYQVKLDNQKADHATAIAKTCSDYEDKIMKQNAGLEQEREAWDAKIRKIKEYHTQQIDAVCSKFDQRISLLESENSDLARSFKNCEIELSESKAAGEERTKNERATYEKQIHQLDLQHATEMETRIRRYESQLQQTRSGHAAELAKMSNGSIRQRNDLETQLAAQKSEYDENFKSLHREHEEKLLRVKQKFKEEIEEMQIAIDLQRKDSETQLAKQKEDFTEASKAMRRENEKLAQIEQDHEGLRLRHNSCEVELRKTKDAHAEEKKAMQSDYENKIGQIHQQHREDLEARFVGYEKKLAKTLDDHQSRIRGIGYKHEDNVAGMKADIERLTREMKDHVQAEDHFKMLLADEKARRKSAVRKFQEIRARLIVVEEQRTLSEEGREE